MARTNLVQFYSMILVRPRQTNLRPSLPRNRKCGRPFPRWRQTPLLINPRFPPSSSPCECVQTNNTTRAFPLPPLFPALKAPSFLPSSHNFPHFLPYSPSLLDDRFFSFVPFPRSLSQAKRVPTAEEGGRDSPKSRLSAPPKKKSVAKGQSHGVLAHKTLLDLPLAFYKEHLWNAHEITIISQELHYCLPVHAFARQRRSERTRVRPTA